MTFIYRQLQASEWVGGGGESENMAMTPAALLHVDNYFLVSKQVKKEKEKNN